MRKPPEALTPAEAALRERLAAGVLTSDDEAMLDRARAVWRAEQRHEPLAPIASDFGVSERQLQRWAQGTTYRVLREHLARTAVAESDASGADSVALARGEYLGLLPHAMRFLGECFERYPAGTQRREGDRLIDISDTIVDRGAAQWATQQLLKGAGLTEPAHVAAPAAVLSAEGIATIVAAIRGDAATITSRTRDRAIETTATPVPPAKETT